MWVNGYPSSWAMYEKAILASEIFLLRFLFLMVPILRDAVFSTCAERNSIEYNMFITCDLGGKDTKISFKSREMSSRKSEIICDRCRNKVSYSTGCDEYPPYTTIFYCLKGHWEDGGVEDMAAWDNCGDFSLNPNPRQG